MHFNVANLHCFMRSTRSRTSLDESCMISERFQKFQKFDQFGAKHSLLHIDFGKSLDLGHCLDLWCFLFIFDVKVATSSEMLEQRHPKHV